MPVHLLLVSIHTRVKRVTAINHNANSDERVSIHTRVKRVTQDFAGHAAVRDRFNPHPREAGDRN